MLEVARSLDEGEMQNIAAYFGTGPALPSLGTSDATLATAGQQIVENGLPDAGIPSCLTCHGAATTSELPLVSHLHGQNATYLKSRLDYMARPSSQPLPGLNPMHTIAAALSDDQRAEVAAWFASQPPLPK